MCTALPAPRSALRLTGVLTRVAQVLGGLSGALWVSLLCPEMKPGWPRGHGCHQTSSFFPLNLRSSYFEGIRNSALSSEGRGD